ncbi:hypothetical protein BS17DRAFT_778804 [Gyrodon lividus]|nr:hypothetical protein BS17DRAFT_778804 [Gyrodon lividus]
MVVLAPPQPNEVEQKKRKQTLERAKANHLSKQLQMRLQYAKLKVEHGWQRQNLNEVENLYFHHSHLRNIRTSALGKTQYANVTSVPTPSSESAAPMVVDANSDIQFSTPLGMDQTSGSSPLHQTSISPPMENSRSTPASTFAVPSTSPPSQSQPEHNQNHDVRPSPPSQLSSSLSYPATQPESHSLNVQMPIPVPAAPTSRPPSTADFSDPNILARLAQLQAQTSSQSQTQPLSRQHTTSTPLSTSSSQPGSTHPQVPAHSQSSFASQPFTLHTQAGFAFPTFYVPAATSQPPFDAFAHTAPSHPPPLPPPSASASASTTPSATAATPTPATHTTSTTTAPTAPALTYDSFWSTHASSTGTTRALYRTHTGFSASAAPSGHVAMLTPGGHAAVMTAEGVYVGGGRSG